MRDIIQKNLLVSAHDLSDGGLCVAIAESCISSRLGAKILLSDYTQRTDKILFGEGGPRFLISISSRNQSLWKEEVSRFNIPNCSIVELGYVTDELNLSISNEFGNLINLSLDDITFCDIFKLLQ